MRKRRGERREERWFCFAGPGNGHWSTAYCTSNHPKTKEKGLNNMQTMHVSRSSRRGSKEWDGNGAIGVVIQSSGAICTAAAVPLLYRGSRVHLGMTGVDCTDLLFINSVRGWGERKTGSGKAARVRKTLMIDDTVHIKHTVPWRKDLRGER